jgi:hypothetical protein
LLVGKIMPYRKPTAETQLQRLKVAFGRRIAEWGHAAKLDIMTDLGIGARTYDRLYAEFRRSQERSVRPLEDCAS